MTEKIQPLVSIIIRTKNEEKWIASCLRSVFKQKYPKYEIIIVDNASTDRTVKRAQEYPVKVINIDEFYPGKAINAGIRVSSGNYIVCLSGHCIPVDDHWLENLVRDLDDPNVAGVYGRQEPLSYSSDFDKRDLITVFGLDKKVQVKDSFFHNANSAIRREVWSQIPFDEQVTNIEDRVWGQQAIAAGMKIIYEPTASVYHWHGIHQDLNPARAQRVVSILESLNGLTPRANHQSPAELNTVAVIPLRGRSRKLNGTTLLEYAIRATRQARYIREVIVATDDQETANIAKSLGAHVPFIRPQLLSEDYVDVADVLRYTLDQIETKSGVPDLIFALEETYPFRTSAMLDGMIERIVNEGLDSVIAARIENRGLLIESDGRTTLVGEGFMPRKLKQSKAMIGLIGFGCVTHPMFLRQGNLFGSKIGVFDVGHPLCSLEVRDEASFDIADKMITGWWDANVN
jgi:rhamnosyltransferase